MKSRDDFKKKTIETLAKRVGYRCSNPDCMCQTVGPKQGELEALSIGIAAHITAAAPGGPRYDPSLSSGERKSIENGLWLCCSCSTLIDRDDKYYTAELLHSWKEDAETRASDAITKPFLEKIKRSEQNFSYSSEQTFYMSLSLDEKLANFKKIMKKSNPTFALEGPENYELSNGFLTLDNKKRPYEKLEIRKFKLFGKERFDIFGRYFQVIISKDNGIPDNFLFVFDINFGDVKDRLTGYENLLPILESKELKFTFSKYNDSIPIATGGIGDWDHQLSRSRKSMELMEMIIDVENYYGITFSLPYLLGPETVQKLDVVYRSTVGEECLNLSGIPDEFFDSPNNSPIVIEKTLITPENPFTDAIELLDYCFTPVDYFILPGKIDINLTTQLWEINDSGIPVTCTFTCETLQNN